VDQRWAQRLAVVRDIQGADEDASPYRQWANDAFRQLALDVPPACLSAIGEP
jgi:hypothetical protein